MSARTKSPRKPEDRPATYADVLAVVNTASAMIAALEARIAALENVVGCDLCGDPPTERFVCADCKSVVAEGSRPVGEPR